MHHRTQPWPNKHARRVVGISLSYQPNSVTVALIMNRLNRGTGYTDPTDLGLMDVEDFRAFAGRVAAVLREVNGETSLMEQLAIKMESHR